MKEGFYWARWKGAIENDPPLVVRVCDTFDWVAVPGDDLVTADRRISDFDFISKESLTPPENT